VDYPAQFDWREHGGLPPIRNQGGCGSCWAFATVGALECNLKIRDNIIVDLSEQYLVSCNSMGWGCNGGYWAHDYHLPLTDPFHKTDPCGNYGPVLETEFPYVAEDVYCACPYTHQTSLCLDDWSEFGPASVSLIKHAILVYGPVGVLVFVDEAFQAYVGGVFNACATTLVTNHAVVLVGWDDNLGSEGCWILRKSWGPGWGEDGYMYIEYGCSRVGAGPAYVDCGLPPMMYFSGDSLYGYPPHTVNFEAFYPDPVDEWSWDFGDGETANVQSPSHTFDERGSYDVSLEVFSGGEYHSLTKELYISVVADTLRTTSAYGQPGEQVVMTLTTFNSAPVEYFKIPVEFPNDFNLRYDSFSTVGCRTEYFERQDYLHYDVWSGKRFTIRLVSSLSTTSPALPPGEGTIVKLYFTIPVTAVDGQSADILLDGYDTYLPLYTNDLFHYEVSAISAGITVGENCCVLCGDANHNGTVDIDDIIHLVDWTFSSGSEPTCRAEAEVDGTEPFTIEDLVYLVDYVYNGGPAPADCP
jgi:PKD repeat protein